MRIPYWLHARVAMWKQEHGWEVSLHDEGELDVMSRVPILGVCGQNGSGKSLLVAELTRRSLEAGRPVLSTVRLLDYENPRPCPGGAACDDVDNHDFDGRVHQVAHPLFVPWTRWTQIDEMGTRFDLWADEITGVASSRESSGLPKYAQYVLAQLRRRDACLRWTGIALERGDLLLREVSQGVVTCNGYASYIDEASGRRYAKKRMFVWDLYDKGVGDVSMHAMEDAGPVASSMFWGPGSAAFGVYDTMAPVYTIGRVTGTGTGVCEHCEGTRRRQECSCADYKSEKDARRAGSPLGGRVGRPAPDESEDGQAA